jgi:hypothetical protein
MPRVPTAARKLGGLMTRAPRRRGVLVEGLARLRDEPRVLDRDDRMVGESANQFDLPLGEGFHAGSHEDNAATLRE